MKPPRIPKATKRSSRWRSQAHCNYVRSHACSICHAIAPIEVAHVRLGSGAGMGQKPDDWHTVSLCKPCHTRQHEQGERTFWAGTDVAALIDSFCVDSPRKHEIRMHRNG